MDVDDYGQQGPLCTVVNRVNECQNKRNGPPLSTRRVVGWIIFIIIWMSVLIVVYWIFCSYTPNGYTYTGPPGNLGYDISGGDFVDSTTNPNSGTGFEQRSSSTELPDSGMMSPSAPTATTTTTTPTALPPESLQISELLARTITDAHNRTCLYTSGEFIWSTLILISILEKLLACHL